MIAKTWIVGMMFLALVGCQAMTGKTAGQNVDDASLTASVKSTLVADKAANLTRIDVDMSPLTKTDPFSLTKTEPVAAAGFPERLSAKVLRRGGEERF